MHVHACKHVIQGFYSVHGTSALVVARDFYRTLAVVKYLGGPLPTSTPGADRASAKKPCSANSNSTPGSNSSSLNSSTRVGLPSVTLSRSLFEGVVQALLLEGAQHTVEVWEGSGANWIVTK
jgi:hypothetical protein